MARHNGKKVETVKDISENHKSVIKGLEKWV